MSKLTSDTRYREARDSDVEELVRIRAAEWQTEEYWRDRIRGYMTGVLSPKQALAPRVIFVAAEDSGIVGFIAGHLTRRYECDGELQWLNVASERRGTGVARELLLVLASWFADKNARRVCVDADPENPTARAFYRKNGAQDLNRGWLVWPDITELIVRP